MKEQQIISDKINNLLEGNPLLSPALSLASYSINKWSDSDWLSYHRETGNEIVRTKKVKDAICILIDEATGFKRLNDIAILKFLLWNIEEFKKGMDY